MKSLNLVQLIGNLGSDPEVSDSNGTLISKFSIALEDQVYDKVKQEKSESTTWQRIVCFNKLAEITKNHLKKGARIYLSGKIKTSKWTDKNNETRYLTEVIAIDLIMLDSKSI